MALVVISGLDGCGKSTQIDITKNKLIESGMKYDIDFTVVKFPRYGHPSAKMVENYLDGKFGNNPSSLSPYVASSFYSIDRALSFTHDDWGKLYNEGKLIIADRFYESNIIHQAANAISLDSDDREIIDKIHCIEHFEYDMELNYFKVPNIDFLIILYIYNPSINWNMLQLREQMNGGDIHERDKEYFFKCHKVLTMIHKYNIRICDKFIFINVLDLKNRQMLRSPDSINEDIMLRLKSYHFI